MNFTAPKKRILPTTWMSLEADSSSSLFQNVSPFFTVIYQTVLRASLVTQMVKNPPSMRETWVRSLGWEDPMATHCSILASRIPMDRGAWRATVLAVANSRTRLNDCARHSTFMAYTIFPRGSVVKNLPAMQEMRVWCLVRNIPWKRKYNPLQYPIFLPGEFHGQRSLAGYSSRGCKRVGTNLATEQPQFIAYSFRKNFLLPTRWQCSLA